MELYNSPILIKCEWKISEEIFQNLMQKSGFLKSEEKEVKEIPGIKFRFELEITDKKPDNVNHRNSVFIYLTLSNLKEKQKYYSKGTWYIKSADFIYSGVSTHTTDIYKCGRSFCSVADLINPKKNFISNGALVINMKAMLFDISAENEKVSKTKKSLGYRLWDSDDKDFTIVVGKKDEAKTEIKIHKCVLAASSPVFSRMLQTDMKEKAQNKLEIIDFISETVQAAVAFCYDQDYLVFLKTPALAFSLFQFSDKYDINGLKNMLELNFAEWVLSSNICEITNAAILSNSLKLQKLCYNYFLIYLRESIPVADFDILDKDFAMILLQKAFDLQNC